VWEMGDQISTKGLLRRLREGGDLFSVQLGAHIDRCPEVPAYARTTEKVWVGVWEVIRYPSHLTVSGVGPATSAG